jgi:hypothetical protein
MSPSVVLVRIDPKSPSYDQGFHDRFQAHENIRNAEVYKRMYDEAMVDNRVLMRVAEARLPHLFNAKKTVELQGYIRHDHGMLPASVTRQLAHQSKAFAAPSPEIEEDSGDVVDAELVEES